VPLAVSSQGPNQIRCSTDGIAVTLTGGAGISVTNGLVVNPADEIVCEVCLVRASDNVIEVWMFSTPRLVAAHRIGAEPCQTFAIPLSAPLDGGGPISAGVHTLQLALPTAQGMQAANVGVTVGGLVRAGCQRVRVRPCRQDPSRSGCSLRPARWGRAASVGDRLTAARG
jgi:hypothetical protein